MCMCVYVCAYVCGVYIYVDLIIKNNSVFQLLCIYLTFIY